MASVFETLNAIDCSKHIEKKNGLAYLSWAWAWAELKKKYPTATYTVYEDSRGYCYHTDGSTCWVKTGVTVDGIEHIEYLPIMDTRNRSIPFANVTSFDVNKAIQRSLTKACARHGLGLYIYAGEDLPEQEETAQEEKPKAKKSPSFKANMADAKAPKEPPKPFAKTAPKLPKCAGCEKEITADIMSAEQAEGIKKKYGAYLCSARCIDIWRLKQQNGGK